MYGISVLFRYQVVSIRSVRYKNNSTKKLLEFLAEMPRPNNTRITEVQRQRQQVGKKCDKYGPSTVYLQVIGSGARGVPNTLYLFTDQKRYMFNCGECTQRLAHEHKVKLSKLDHIFITSKTWQNIGGLPGLSLTLQDVGVPNITLHGPEGLDELYNATRRFVIIKDMNVTMAKCSPSEDFEDNVMNVKYVLLGPHDDLLVSKDLKPAAKRPKLETVQDKEFEEFTHDETDYYRPEARHADNSRNNRNVREKPKAKVNVEKADPMKKKTEKVLHDLQKKTHCSVAYICTLKKRLGTLVLSKCVEMGVKPGPMLGQLKNGHDVVLPDGTLVLSKDVKTPDDPGPVFIVLDVPELSYLKEAEFSAHFDTPENPPENIPSLIVHYTPPAVFNHPTYRSFMSLFGPSTRHLVLNAQNSCLGSEAVHRTQHKLHLLDPDIFPLLRDASVPAVWNSHPPLPKTNSPVRLKGLEELKNKIALAQFQNIINMEGSCKGDGGQPHAAPLDEEQNKLELITGRTMTMFHLRPKKQLDRSAEPKLHVQDYIQETMDVDGFVGSLEHFRRQVDSLRYAKTDTKEYPKVVFLGTGSCIPSKTRNTSAIVLHIDDNRSMLLDCGEGTFGQLVRFYGPKRVSAFLRTLKAIYISHLHADHHIGLIGVILARRQAMLELNPDAQPEPLYLLAPGQIYTWLTMYDQQFERIRADFTLIPNQSLLYTENKTDTDMTSAVLANIGVEQIRTCYVSHCPNAFGVAVDVDAHHRLTYSGDTIPCDELVRLGENSTLLIHEATMEDELADEARIKMHSTTSQAIDVGRQMGARYTVLTHFSQRYARLPRLNAHMLHRNRSVGIAFDNMQITMSDLELLPHMYAPLQLMFAEHCVEMELKAAQRARQKERASSPSLAPGTHRQYSTQAHGDAPAADTDETNETANASVNASVSANESVSADAPAADEPANNNATQPDDNEKPSRLRNRSESRPRKPPPGCFATASAPAPRANYRESNASRLRQEIKGMTVTGIVRRGGARSKSSSPNKSTPNSQCMTPKPNSGTTTPRSYGGLPEKRSEVTAGRVQNVAAKPRSRQEVSPDKSTDLLATPRSMSETSSSTRVTQERIRSVLAKASSGYVVDTRSKTLATAIRQPISASEEALCGRRDSRSNSPNGRFGSGYGKPLVTSLNKKLTVMKTEPKYADEVRSTKIPVGRAKSPVRSWRTEHKESLSSVTDKKFELTKSKSPAKGVSGNKLRTSNTVLNKDDKVGITKSSVPGKQIRGSTTSLNKYSANKSPTRTDNKQDVLNSRAKPLNPVYPRDTKTWSPEFSPSPSRQKSRRPFAPTPNKTPQHDTKADKKDLPSFKPSPPKTYAGVRSPSSERKKQNSPFRDMLSERLKQQLCKDVPISIIGRPSSGLYSKSFKPQLEDIKSSFMLLNKKTQEQSKEKENKKELVSVHKPKQFNEEFRKQQLIEIKKKFQSKHFFDDSKYDKIEGLNWISWK